jgi:hypothetical protein
MCVAYTLTNLYIWETKSKTMLPLITTKIKDDTLQWLCHNVPLSQLTQINLPGILNTTNVDSGTIRAILEDFREIGLLENLILTEEEEGDILLTLKLKAHSFVQRGGFAVEDALNEANIQKILLELENLQKELKPDQVDAFNKAASIASSIATVLTAFSDRN